MAFPQKFNICFLLHNIMMMSYLPTLCDQPNLIAELVSSGISSMCTCSDDSSIIVHCEHTYCSSPHSTTLQHEHLQTYANHCQLLLLNLHTVRVKSKVYSLQHIVNCLNIWLSKLHRDQLIVVSTLMPLAMSVPVVSGSMWKSVNKH